MLFVGVGNAHHKSKMADGRNLGKSLYVSNGLTDQLKIWHADAY